MTKILNKLGILFMMLTLFTAFSCSNDDNDTPAWETLAGEYADWTSATFKYSATPMATDNEKLTFSVANGKLNVELASNQWGTATFSNVTVTQEGSNFKLTGAGSAQLGMHGGSSKAHDCTLAATVSKDKKKMNVIITYPAVMGGTTVTFTLGEAPAAQLLAGTYNGWTKGDSNYFKNRTQNGEKLAITANEDGTVNVKLTSQMWGETTIANVKAEKTTNGFALSGSGKFSMSMGTNAKEYDCTLSGTLSADKTTYSVTFNLPAVMGGLTIAFAEGEAPAAE